MSRSGDALNRLELIARKWEKSVEDTLTIIESSPIPGSLIEGAGGAAGETSEEENSSGGEGQGVEDILEGDGSQEEDAAPAAKGGFFRRG